MKRKTAACLLLLTASLQALPVFIGTNTGKNTTSKGIYRADFDPATGTLTKPVLAAEYQSPGFLAEHPSKPVLLSIGAPGKPFADGSSSVAAFAIGADYGLKFLGEASTAGKGACHLAVDPAGRTVAVANYGDGHISTVRLDENGVPQQPVSRTANFGTGPDKSRQEGPHAHGVYFDKTGTRLFAPDLGLDKVFVYPFDPATSKLGEPLAPLKTAPGAGPRHMAFSPDWRHAYVICEMGGSLLAASYENRAFQQIGTVSTLPEGFSGINTSAEVEVSADGRFVYASNRGPDDIAVFQRDAETGKLTFLERTPCGGKHPRHFKIAPGGKWLLCAHMNSDTISVLPRDPQTGKLSAATSTVSSPSPICLLFPR